MLRTFLAHTHLHTDVRQVLGIILLLLAAASRESSLDPQIGCQTIYPVHSFGTHSSKYKNIIFIAVKLGLI